MLVFLCLGTSAEEFIIKNGGSSKKEKFHKLLAGLLQTSMDNVDIITVMDIDGFTDVRYSAHGSPYYPSSQTDSLVVLNKNQVTNFI